MHRYRVNYRLLVGLFLGSFVTAGASYGMWRFQVDRNATRLLGKAEIAEKQGDIEQAYENLDQYVKLRPRETAARIRLGKAAAKYVTDEKLDMKTRSEVYQTLRYAVTISDDAALRRELVDLQVKFRAFDDALQNIDALLDVGKTDPDIKAMKAQCLFETKQDRKGVDWCYRLIGYDQKTKTFDAAKAEAPDKPLPYALLAQYLYGNDQAELAVQVLDRMIAANPESKEAYVLHYQFLKVRGEHEAARSALEKAYALDPTDANVLSFKGSEAIADYQKETEAAQGPEAEAQRTAAKKHLDAAATFFAEGLKRYPDSIVLYERAAQVEQMRDNQAEGLAIADRGLRKFPMKEHLNREGMPLALNLLSYKLDVLLAKREFDAAKKEVQKLRDLNNARVTPVAEFYEARMIAIDENWAEAARRLDAVKPRLVNSPDLQALAGAIQGFCHAQLGQADLAYEAYDWALKKNPNLALAKEGRDQMRNMIQPGEQEADTSQLDQRIREMLALPKDQQDWTAIETEIDAFVENQLKARGLSPELIASRKKLLRARVTAMRAEAADPADKPRLLAQARAEFEAAYAGDLNDSGLQEQLVRLQAQDGEDGPAKALAMLDKFVSESKDAANLKMVRVDLLLAIRGEEISSQLEAVTQGMDEWDKNQQALVWLKVGNAFEKLGKFPEAQRCIEQAVTLTPNNLPYRIALFDTALKQADDVAMRNAQQKILEIVKSESDPGYVLTEIKRRIVGFERGTVSLAELKEARSMLDEAIENRPTLADLHVVSGQLWIILEKNVDRALASFDEALKFGPANLNALNLQVRLLFERNRVQEAREKMKVIPEAKWAPLLDRVAAAVLQSVGESDRAFVEAEKVALGRPDDDTTQVWFAQVATQAKQYEKAEAAFKKAIAIDPSNPDHWTGLVSVYLQLKRGEDVERTLREAHLALDAEYLPLLSGKYYELQSRWQDAEDIYLAAYSGRLEQSGVARRLAEFYLTWAGSDEANRGKANSYINRILKSTYEGKLEADNPDAVWARQQAARLLAQNGGYKNSLKAEQLLTSAKSEGDAAKSDQEYLIDVLSQRGDPASRERVIAMLREMRKKYGLSPPRELLLGHGLYELDEWEACKAQMMDAIDRYPADVGLKSAYASMLIGRKDFPQAERAINDLKGMEGTQRSVAELQLRLASAQGNKAGMRKALESITPELKVLDPEQLEMVLAVAQLADNVGDHEYALKLMREYSRRAPGRELELARLVTRYGPLDEGLTMLKQLFESNMDGVVGMAVEMLRYRRAEAPERLDAEVKRLVEAARRDDPDSARRMVSEAELMEIQQRYDESIASYEKLLVRDDVPEVMRAAADNNLAFLLAINRRELDRALAAANQAIDVIGPISDILDTRALVYIARGDFAEAVDDMKLAVKVGPTPSKYFHLAVAHLGAGDEEAALAAWKKAEEAGIAPENVSKLEHEQLEEVRKKFDALRTSTAQL